MKKSLFLAFILGLIYPAYSNTATQMNSDLKSAIQASEYKEGEDFVVYFKLAHTATIPNAEYMTAIMAVGDESVMGTWTKNSLYGDGFLISNPVAPAVDYKKVTSSSSSGKVTFTPVEYTHLTDPSSSEHKNLWFAPDYFTPFIPDDGTRSASSGWRILDSTVLAYYNAQNKTLTYRIGLTHLNDSGTQDDKTSLTLTLTDADMNANQVHFVTDTDITTGGWKSPATSYSASDFYQTLNSSERSWLSNLYFANAPAGSYILIDDANTVTENGSGSGVLVIALDGDNTITNGATLEATEDGADARILSTDGTNTIDNGEIVSKGDIILTAQDNKVLNGSNLGAGHNIQLDAGNTNTIDKANAEAGLDIIITGTDNEVLNGSTLDAVRNIQLDADNTNTIDNSTLTAGDTITLDGSNKLYGGSKLDADHVVIRDDNDIHDAFIHANKTVSIETGANPGKHTVIGDNTTITAGQIAISGASPENQADIAGAGITIDATKGMDKAQTGNVILDNAHVHDLAKPITANGGSIILRNTDTIENATLAIADAVAAPGSILAASRSTTNIGDGVNLIGRLASEDTTAALNKLGTDDLLINYDDSAFNGTINMVGANKNQGRLIVTDEFVPAGGSVGVGAEAQINLNGHSMVVSGMESAPMTASLGNLNATGARVEVNYGVVGDQMHLKSLTMGHGGLLCIDVDPVNKVADCLTIDGKLYNDGTPFLYVNHVTDPDKASLGTRLTVLKVNGDVTGMTKDVISDNGPKDLNMYMEFVGSEGQLVYSDNFYSVNGGPNQNAVKEALIEIENAGTAEPGSALSDVLSSLHHTRSAKDARAALQSLSAAANLLAPHMMMDSTRHHLDTLRRHMSMPAYKANICTGDNKGGVTANGLTPMHEVWAYYSGGHDHLNGDEALGAYNRNYQGGMVGCTRTIGYESRHAVGFAVGFEHASASVTDARMRDNTVYLDLYAITRHKQYTHRFNAGVGIHNFKLDRSTSVLAGAFSRFDHSSASMTATSINLGYEFSRDFVYSPYTTYTAFAALDVAIHSLGTLRERGRLDASVNTEYYSPVQVDFAAGMQWSRRVSSFSACVPGRVYAALSLHAEFSDRRPTAKNSFQADSSTMWKTRSQKRDAIYGEFSAGANLPFNQRWAGHIGGDFEFGAERLSIGGYAGVSYTF